MTMRRAVSAALVLTAVLAITLPAFGDDQPTLKDEKDRVNYGIGVSVIRNFQQQGMEIDLDKVMLGMRDAVAGSSLRMDEKELRKTLNAYQNELRRKQAVARATAATENKKAGEEFLAANGKKKGVITLPSGLQYKVLKQGTGKLPQDADMAEFNYRGSFVNGSEFDSTFDSDRPATVKVQEGGGIRGWSEALKLMPVGSKWQLYIPPQLAYGENGRGLIGPNVTLIFDIELLAIK